MWEHIILFLLKWSFILKVKIINTKWQKISKYMWPNKLREISHFRGKNGFFKKTGRIRKQVKTKKERKE